jgi:hypothetical protein
VTSPMRSYSYSFFQKIGPLRPIHFFITTHDRAMFLPTYAHLLNNEQGTPFASRLKRAFRVRRIRRISRRALGEPTESLFMKLYNSGCVQSMITYTGFNFQAFNDLLQLFQPQFERLSPYSTNGRIRSVRRVNGRRRKITAIQCLGLVLAWTRT